MLVHTVAMCEMFRNRVDRFRGSRSGVWRPLASPSVESRERSKCTGHVLGRPRRLVGFGCWVRQIEGWLLLHSEYAPHQLVGSRLRAVRLSLGLSQKAFADTVKAVGLDIGEPNFCSKRLVQKWEACVHGMPAARYRHAIEKLTGEPFSYLCAPTARTAPKDRTDAARRMSRAIATMTLLEAELYDLHAFLNRDPELEAEYGPRQ